MMSQKNTKQKAVIIFSGGLDSTCSVKFLRSKYDLYGLTFSYGQRANAEVKAATTLASKLNLAQHKVIDISFMKEIYGSTNVLTSTNKGIPQSFDYSIVVPIRNAVFLSIASAWAFSLNASVVAYGAHTGDINYPDCRPAFAEKIESAFNEGESDGIKHGLRSHISIWSPYRQGLSKVDLLRAGLEALGDCIFQTWSCYHDGDIHCGNCESCTNRKRAFVDAGIPDKTAYTQ